MHDIKQSALTDCSVPFKLVPQQLVVPLAQLVPLALVGTSSSTTSASTARTTSSSGSANNICTTSTATAAATKVEVVDV